jgi:Winged helix-turn helix
MTVIAMSRTEIDRMSVLQDLAASRIKITEAAMLMGLGRRQVFRLAKAYGQDGPQALVSRRRGRPSNRCYPTALHAEVIGIIRERYSDFGPTLAAEKLAELHDIHLARETVRQWMITAGLWKDRDPIQWGRSTPSDLRQTATGEPGSDHREQASGPDPGLHRRAAKEARHVPFRQGVAATQPEGSYVQGRIDGHPGVALRDLEASRDALKGIQPQLTERRLSCSRPRL